MAPTTGKARGNVNRNRAGTIFLIVGYACVVGLIVNLCTRFGIIHIRLLGMGFVARWIWVLGAAICFVLAWYTERLGAPHEP